MVRQTRPARHVERTGHAHGGVHGEASEGLGRLLGVALEHVVEEDGRLPQVREAVMQHLPHRARRHPLVGDRQGPNDKEVQRAVEIERSTVEFLIRIGRNRLVPRHRGGGGLGGEGESSAASEQQSLQLVSAMKLRVRRVHRSFLYSCQPRSSAKKFQGAVSVVPIQNDLHPAKGPAAEGVVAA